MPHIPRILGVDPGLDGALCWNSTSLDYGGIIIEDMPTIEITVGGKKRRRIDVHAFRDMLISGGTVSMVVIEEPTTRPGEAPQNAMQTGRGWGELYGVLVALDRPITVVRSQVWTKALGVGKDKGVHVQVAQRLFPEQAHQFVGVRGGLKDGRADAALMTHWWLRGGN